LGLSFLKGMSQVVCGARAAGEWMITTALDTISVVASSILSSALVSAVVQILFKQHADERLARIKERADTDLEQLRNQLAIEKGAREEDRHRLSEQIKIQFSWLYVERAKAMNEIYACVIEADEAVRNCIPVLRKNLAPSSKSDRSKR
jgi:cytidylate kinase